MQCTISNRPDSPLPAYRVWNNLCYRAGANDTPIAQTGKGITLGIKEGGGRPERVEWYNNTIVDSEGNGAQVTSRMDRSVTIQNNIIVGSGSADISNSGTGSNTVNNNETGSKSAQNFVNAGSDDYKLTSSSPARNNATTGFIASDDLDDRARPLGSAADRGCYEFVE